MSDVIEGRNAVLEALRAGLPLERILIAQGVKDDEVLREIRERAASTGVTTDLVARRSLDSLSNRKAHQGVLARCESFRYTELDDVLRRSEPNARSLLLVLDHVTDPGNLGAAARSAEVAGADAVLIPKDRSAGVTSVVWKASAGAVGHLPIVRVTNLARTLTSLKGAGYWVVGAAAEAAISLWDAELGDRVAVVLGSEGRGLSRLVSENCDQLVSIPVAGNVSSLNVAQAASVLMLEWVRQGRRPG